jgi:hypothetical protein
MSRGNQGETGNTYALKCSWAIQHTVCLVYRMWKHTLWLKLQGVGWRLVKVLSLPLETALLGTCCALVSVRSQVGFRVWESRSGRKDSPSLTRGHPFKKCWGDWLWCNPSYWEAQVGGSESEVDLGKSARPSLKNKLKAKILGIWLNW